LNENEQVKRQPIIGEHKLGVKQLIEDMVEDIRRYWGPDKQILIAGDEGRVQAAKFNAQQIPDFYVVHVPKGASKPRSQAAELKKVEDVAQYSLNSGQPLPVAWFKASLDAGEALELPEQPSDDHADNAELENELMFAGKDVQVVYYDPAVVHIPIHRGAQIRAMRSDDMDAWQRIEQHVQQHIQVAEQNAAENAQLAPPVPVDGTSQPPQQQHRPRRPRSLSLRSPRRCPARTRGPTTASRSRPTSSSGATGATGTQAAWSAPGCRATTPPARPTSMSRSTRPGTCSPR
jgi:hypothetical protein